MHRKPYKIKQAISRFQFFFAFLFLHVNRQVKVFYRLAVVFSCSCLSLISRLFMFTFSLTEAESFISHIVTVQEFYN